MPPPKNPTQKKKKKGPAPKHQNTFAFQHNPKSKTTAKILASPNIHVCRRCHDKIEWRKQYRKYKPRTQPGKCNSCEKRNVVAAYHTICESCTLNSTKAKAIIAEELESRSTTEEEMPTIRACAVCVKEVALPDPEDDEDDDLAVSVGRIRLRERKAIERKLMQESTKKNTNDESSSIEEGSESSEKMNNAFDQPPAANDDEDDPFLKAVGGADKLLTGEAYQKKLLEQHQQQQQQTSVKKIVLATGTATATIFLPSPRATNLYPFSRYSNLTVSENDLLVLNISFRITSSGLVNAAPATPAVADFAADRQRRSWS
eukprot:scaffold13207_cov143-Cylindrotheca_fusiformis.AAC.18